MNDSDFESGDKWQAITSSSPPEGVPVFTRINDERGPRNEAVLKRKGRLWFFADGSMYVYYTPTEWKHAPYEGGRP